MTEQSAIMMTAQTPGCRFLYVVGQLGLGGLERQLCYLLSNLNRDRYRPALVAWNFDPSEKYFRDIEDLNIPIYGLPEASPLSKLYACRALARKLRPEVIHSYGFHTNFASYYAAQGIAAVPIGSLRGDFARDKSEGGIIRGILNARWPHWHISNSLTTANQARQYSGYFVPPKVLVVRNGLDLNRFSGSNGAAGIRNYVAAVGSLFPVKRWDRLLKAVQRITSITQTEIDMRIAGDGPLRAPLKRLAQDLGISGAIKFVGPIQDMPTFLRQARFLVHSSESEGCPNAIMEAMACGLPVIAMEAGDIPHLIEEGKNGFVVAQDDIDIFADRIIQLLHDGALCRSFGQAARAKAVREFGLERLVSETLCAYRTAGWQDLSPRVEEQQSRDIPRPLGCGPY
jgi:glycosyltransferase involved in cell wall biosynthesis